MILNSGFPLSWPVFRETLQYVLAPLPVLEQLPLSLRPSSTTPHPPSTHRRPNKQLLIGPRLTPPANLQRTQQLGDAEQPESAGHTLGRGYKKEVRRGGPGAAVSRCLRRQSSWAEVDAMTEGKGAEEGRSEVSLVIKSPAQHHPDLLLPAQRAWSVRRLKMELHRRHPDQPPEDCQRLIYSGKLLQDHLFLEEILAKQEVTHAVHLVCNSKNVPETNRNVAEAKQWGIAFSQHPSVVSSLCAWNQRERSCNQPSTTKEAANRSQLQPPFQGLDPGYSSYTMYHLLQLWFQQIYARQYYMQYMSASSAPSDSSIAQSAQDIPVAPVAAPAPLPGPFPADNQPRIQDAPRQVNPGVNQNLQMNAQGGPVMEEDEVNRDWLDWLYSATLFYVLVNVVYFYSSLSRLLMVMVGTLLMYLHQGRFFPFRQRQVQPAQNNVPPQEAVNQDQNNNLPEENIGDPGEMEVPEAVPENQPATPSFMSTAWLFFKAFFASLLPEGTPAAAN